MPAYDFAVVQGAFAVARLAGDAPIPAWALLDRRFSSVTRTAAEVSIVCSADTVPEGVQAEVGWSLLKLVGPFPFSQVGVLSSFAGPLAAAGISLFAISTFDTDYILVKHVDLAAACDALVHAGHRLVSA